MSFSIAQGSNLRFRSKGFEVLRPVNPIAALSPNLWLDSSNSPSIIVTSDPDVDQWNDLSTFSNNVSESTASDKPHTGIAQIGGLNALEFDGTDDGLVNSTAGGTFTGTSGDLYVIVEFDTVASLQHILASADESSTDGIFAANLSPAGTLRIGSEISGTTNMFRGTTALSADTPYILRFYSTGSVYALEVNGVNETLVADPSFPGSSNTGDWFGDLGSRDNFTIGHLLDSGGRSLFFNGTLGELVYFDNKVLTDLQSDVVTAFLNAKWQI